MEINNKIATTAAGYVGQMELKNNSGFKNTTFAARMAATGWKTGEAWCAYFCELVWAEAYAGTKQAAEIKKLFSGSATATFKNFDLAENWETTTTTPKVGALMVWRVGSGWRGHIGIVTQINADGTVLTIEGNTNAAGGREGVEVAPKTRRIVKPYNANKLNVVGFVWPNAADPV